MTRRVLAIACVLSILATGAGYLGVAAAVPPPTITIPTFAVPIETTATVYLSPYIVGGSGQYLYSWVPCDPVQDEFGFTTVDANTGVLMFTPNELFTIYGAAHSCFTVTNTVPNSTPVRGSIEFVAIYPLEAGDGSFELEPRNTLVDRLTPIVSGGVGGLSFSLESPTSHGTIVVSPSGDFEYQPDGGPWSQDSFSYRVTDFDGNEAVGTISISLVYDTSVPSYGSVDSGGTGDGGGSLMMPDLQDRHLRPNPPTVKVPMILAGARTPAAAATKRIDFEGDGMRRVVAAAHRQLRQQMSEELSRDRIRRAGAGRWGRIRRSGLPHQTDNAGRNSSVDHIGRALKIGTMSRAIPRHKSGAREG